MTYILYTFFIEYHLILKKNYSNSQIGVEAGESRDAKFRENLYENFSFAVWIFKICNPKQVIN